MAPPRDGRPPAPGPPRGHPWRDATPRVHPRDCRSARRREAPWPPRRPGASVWWRRGRDRSLPPPIVVGWPRCTLARVSPIVVSRRIECFFFNVSAPTEIYTLSLHDALPI